MSESWWKEAVIYQIYPSSFKDSSNRGWGDLKGIISKVDYLKELGADIIWISPMCKSPHADMGYDISDYKTIDPRYGTNEDVDTLIAELKKRNMGLMMDLVVNHTSEQHEWFKASRSSRTSPKRDWYIWKPPRGHDDSGDLLPPNNWSQILGEANSAWTYDKATNEYYLSLFTPEQPDLNWENPDVRAAVHDVMRFWLDKGACGYRMDVINLISKDQSFPDADETITIKPPKSGKEGQTKYHPGWKWYINGPRMHEFHQELKREVLEPYKAITVGEMPRVSDADEVLKTVGQRDGNLKMMFIFDVVDVDNVPGQGRLALNEWTLRDIVKPIEKWQRLMTERDGWNSVFIENHDNPRSVSRYCDDADEWREKGAKLLALMQTTLSGTIFVYQGEEIGMRNMPKGWGVEEYKDIESVNFWKKSLELYGGDDDDEEGLREARKVLDLKARDHARTPMQWDDSPHAGFCGGEAEPWMRVMDDYPTVNVEVQMQADGGDDLSVWRFWQRGLANRKEHADAFVHGEYQTVEGAEGGSVFAYLKTGEESGKWLIVLNFSGWDVDWSLPEELQLQGWMAGNYVRGKPDKPTKGVVSLRSWEGLLGKCTS